MNITIQTDILVGSLIIVLLIGLVVGGWNNMIFALFRMVFPSALLKVGLPIFAAGLAFWGLQWVSIWLCGATWPMLVVIPLVVSIVAAYSSVFQGWH